MDGKSSISEILKTRKCFLCGYLLSVPPIMTAGLENELYQCGRCELVTSRTPGSFVVPSFDVASFDSGIFGHPNLIRHNIYPGFQPIPQVLQSSPRRYRIRLFEDVAQFLSFPCSYPKCNKKIPWGRVVHHERNCTHRTIRCPMFHKKCAKIIEVDQFEEHFREHHQSSIKEVGSFLEVNNLASSVYLMKADRKYFFIYILERGTIGVLALQHSKYTTFNVKMEVISGNNFAISFDNLPVVPFDDRSHCHMCYMKQCSEPHHPFSSRNNRAGMNLGSKLRNELLTGLDTYQGALRYCITLIADNTIVEALQLSREAETTTEEENHRTHSVMNQFRSKNSDVLRRCLTCPICLTYMAAPIYTCATGHSVCKLCKPKLNRCPTCQSTFGQARSYALEDLASEVMVPCHNDLQGCTYMGPASSIFLHELNCFCDNY